MGRRVASVELCHAERLVPHVVLAVHVHGRLPLAGFGVVVLCFLQVALHLELLGQVKVRVLQQILAVCSNQADHLVVLAGLLVHVDGQVGLVHSQVQALGLLELVLTLQLVRLLGVQAGHLRLAHAAHGHIVRCVPPASQRVHLDGSLGRPRLDVEALSLLQVSSLMIMAGNALVERMRRLRVTQGVLDKLHSLGELAGVKSGVDSSL
mmetsp:Transcript_142881/g.347109  ORF Transcript_142881/g.347109 Transcript_142881/m.347109 type:complete len:208 (+) Transcript_142881:2047-2670(+)